MTKKHGIISKGQKLATRGMKKPVVTRRIKNNLISMEIFKKD